MSTEPTNQPEPAGWGDTPPPAQATQKKWSGRKTAVAVGVAVVIAAGGGVAIAVGTSGNADNAAVQGRPGGGRNMGGPGGFGNNAGVMTRDALHGDFVVSDGNGGYANERVQTGTVSEVSATSITVTSKDNYKQTYTIDASTRKASEPKNGDTVTLTAKVNGTTATATTVGTPGQATRGGGYGGQPNGNRRPGN